MHWVINADVNANPPEKYRFYCCVPKNMHREAMLCTKIKEEEYEAKKRDVQLLGAKTVKIGEGVPEFLDHAILSYKVRDPILIKKFPPFQG